MVHVRCGAVTAQVHTCSAAGARPGLKPAATCARLDGGDGGGGGGTGISSTTWGSRNGRTCGPRHPYWNKATEESRVVDHPPPLLATGICGHCQQPMDSGSERA